MTLLKPCLAVALLACTAPPILADTGSAKVISVSPTPLKVHSNGSEYHLLSLSGNAGIAVQLSYDTETSGRIKSWWAYPTLSAGYGPAASIDLSDLKQSASYPVGGRPKSINKTLSFSVSKHRIETMAVAMCNRRFEDLRKAGKSKSQIFAQNQKVNFKVGVSSYVDATGAGQNHLMQASTPIEWPVTCLKWSGSQIPTVGGFKTPKANDGTGHWNTQQRGPKLKTTRLKPDRN